MIRYIEQAIRHQEANIHKMNKVVTAMKQVNEQPVTGATSAASASIELKQVVDELQRLVGA